MLMKILGVLLGVFLILVGIWNFDLNNWNKIIISVLLLLSGLITLSTDTDSEVVQKTRGLLLYVSGVIVILFAFKLFILD